MPYYKKGPLFSARSHSSTKLYIRRLGNQGTLNSSVANAVKILTVNSFSPSQTARMPCRHGVLGKTILPGKTPDDFFHCLGSKVTAEEHALMVHTVESEEKASWREHCGISTYTYVCGALYAKSSHCPGFTCV